MGPVGVEAVSNIPEFKGEVLMAFKRSFESRRISRFSPLQPGD